MLPILSKLLSSSENWYDIKEQDDYQYPGKFSEVLDVWDMHQIFLLYRPRKMSIFFLMTYKLARGSIELHGKSQLYIVDDKEEEVKYCIAPCGGVKCCPVEDCSYCAPNCKHQPCPHHHEASLVSSGE